MGIIWVHFYLVIISNVLVFFFLGSTFIKNYNSLTNLAEKMKEGWGQIEANLQRRYDALLTMSQVVQGYAGHEQAIDSFVAKAQSVIGSPDGVIGPVKKATDAEHLIDRFQETFTILRIADIFVRRHAQRSLGCRLGPQWFVGISDRGPGWQ